MKKQDEFSGIGEPDDAYEFNAPKSAPKLAPYQSDSKMVRIILHCPISSLEYEEDVGSGIVRLSIEPKDEIVIMKWFNSAGRRYQGWFKKREWIAVMNEVQKEISRTEGERAFYFRGDTETEVRRLGVANNLLACRVEELEAKIRYMKEESEEK